MGYKKIFLTSFFSRFFTLNPTEFSGIIILFSLKNYLLGFGCKLEQISLSLEVFESFLRNPGLRFIQISFDKSAVVGYLLTKLFGQHHMFVTGRVNL